MATVGVPVARVGSETSGTINAKEAWSAALGVLQLEVSKPNYNTWFSKTVGLEFTGNQFRIGVPNTFVAEYLTKNQCSMVEKALISVTKNSNIKAVFTVADVSRSPQALAGPLLRTPSMDGMQLNPKYTFDTFIPSIENRVALAAAQDAGEKSGSPMFPLIFYHGPSGVGKTHLMHAIGNAARTRKVDVAYVTAEQFTNGFIASLRNGTAAEFRDRFRNAGMLLIDDIPFIGGKAQTEESLFHLFNELFDSGRQIVLTSNCLPDAIPKLDSRLMSRFNGGLSIKVQPPGVEARKEILRSKAQADGMALSPEVIRFVAENITQDVRVLEGALNRIKLQVQLLNKLVTPGLLPGMIGDLLTVKQQGPHLTPEQVLEAGAGYFKIDASAITGKQRDGPTAEARQLIAYVLRQETDFSLSDIGRVIGDRSPATVSFAYSKIREKLETGSDKRLSEAVEYLTRLIRD